MKLNTILMSVLGLVFLSVSANGLHAQARPQLQPAGGTPHSATLTWMAGAPVTGVTVAGYNVYRGSAPMMEGASAINSTLVSGLTYADTSVTAGASYCYIVEAQSGTGNQSGPSNEVCVTIPSNPNAPTLTITSASLVTNGNKQTITASYQDTPQVGTFYVLWGSNGSVLKKGTLTADNGLYAINWTGRNSGVAWLDVCDALGSCVSQIP